MEPRRALLQFALFAGQLLTTWALALSNVLLGLATLALFTGGRPRLASPSARRLFRIAAAYLLLLVASVAASDDPRASVRGLSEIFSFAVLGLALVHLRGSARVRWLVDALILVAAVVALDGLAQLGIGLGGSNGVGDIERRIRGPFSHYMTFAGFLLIVDLLLVGRLLRRRKGERGDAEVAKAPTRWLDRSWVALLCLGLISTALISSLTRSAWIALAAALALVVALVRPRLLLWAPPLAAALLLAAPVPVVHRLLSITSLTDGSNYDRICMAEAGLRMVGERPLLGFGPDLVKRVYPLYRHPTAPRLLVPHLHNSYLQVAAEQGIPALAILLALLGSAAADAWRGFRRDNADADLHLGVLGALAAFAVAGLFEHNWGDSEVQRTLLVLLAVPAGLSGDRDAPEPDSAQSPEAPA